MGLPHQFTMLFGFASKMFLAVSARPSATDRRLHGTKKKSKSWALKRSSKSGAYKEITNDPHYHPHTPRAGVPSLSCCDTSLHNPENGAYLSLVQIRATKPASNL